MDVGRLKQHGNKLLIRLLAAKYRHAASVLPNQDVNDVLSPNSLCLDCMRPQSGVR